MRKLFLAVTAVLVSQAAFAQNLIVTPADNGKPIALKVGQCLDVRLQTQGASTGYEWYLAPGMDEKMSLAARKLTTPGNAPPGAPSQLDFILCAASPGAMTVKFLNYRIWEKNVSPAKTLSFPVTITE